MTTKIEWVKNPDGSQGYTWNPITGCLKVPACLYCYARKLANGRLKSRYLANDNLIPPYEDSDGFTHTPTDLARMDMPFYPRFWEERILPLHTPRKTNSPKKGIFVCDMGELFGNWIPRSWQEQVFNAIKANPDYRFYLLTKQPQNLIKWSPFPENCWVGVTATNKPSFNSAMKGLINIKAKVKFISFEPLLERIYVDPISFKGFYEYANMPNTLINWLIIGAQTKPYKPPEISWIREIVEAADKAGIPVFLKDNLNPMFAKNDCAGFNQYKDQLFTIIDNFPTRYHLRQEMPEV